jgi:protein O-mannosyl-transferase
MGRKRKHKKSYKSNLNELLQSKSKDLTAQAEAELRDTVIASNARSKSSWYLSTWFAALVLAVLGFAVFSSGLNNPFQGDDQLQLVNNPVVHSVSHVLLLFDGSTAYYGKGIAPLGGLYYRPIMMVVYSLIYAIFGLHPFYYHLLQLLIYIGSSFILYLIFRYIFNGLLSLTLVLVFLVHPINSQAVYTIPAMQDALFFFFGILAMWLLVRFSSTRSLILVALSLLLSLLSKEAGFLFVVMAVVYMLWFDRKRLYPFIWVVVPTTIFWLILRVHAVGLDKHPNAAPIDNLGLAGRLMTAPSIMLLYVSKLLFPWKLSSFYYWTYPNFSIRHFLVPLMIDLAVIALAVYAALIVRARLSSTLYRMYIFFATWAAVGLVAHLQIIPLDMTAAEYYFYFSFAGLLGMIGIVLIAFQSQIKMRWFLTSAVLLIAILGARTYLRGNDWANTYRIASLDVANSSENYNAYNTIANESIQNGNYAQAKMYAQRSISIFPSYQNYANLGLALAGTGDYSGANIAYVNSIHFNPPEYVYDDLGTLTLVHGTPASSKQVLTQMLSSHPYDALLWQDLAIVNDRFYSNDTAKADITNAAKYGLGKQDLYNAIMSGQPFTINTPSSLDPSKAGSTIQVR